MKTKVFFLLVFLLPVCAFSQDTQDSIIKIVILEYDSELPTLSAQFNEELINYLIRINPYQNIRFYTRQDVLDILPQYPKTSDPDEAVRIGEQLNVDYVIFGSIGEMFSIEDSLSQESSLLAEVNTSMVDVGAKELLAGFQIISSLATGNVVGVVIGILRLIEDKVLYEDDLVKICSNLDRDSAYNNCKKLARKLKRECKSTCRGTAKDGRKDCRDEKGNCKANAKSVKASEMNKCKNETKPKERRQCRKGVRKDFRSDKKECREENRECIGDVRDTNRDCKSFCREEKKENKDDCCKPRIMGSMVTCEDMVNEVRDKVRESHFDALCSVKRLKSAYDSIWNQTGSPEQIRQERISGWNGNQAFVKWFGIQDQNMGMDDIRIVGKKLEEIIKLLDSGKVRYIIGNSKTMLCLKSKYGLNNPFSKRRVFVCTGWFMPDTPRALCFGEVEMDPYNAGSIVHELCLYMSYNHKHVEDYCSALKLAETDPVKARKNPWNYDGIIVEFYFCDGTMPECEFLPR